MLPSLGPLEILVILVVVVLVFPPHKLPELARNLGRGMTELRRMHTSLRADLDQFMDFNEDPPAADDESGDGGEAAADDTGGESSSEDPAPPPPRPRPPSRPGA